MSADESAVIPPVIDHVTIDTVCAARTVHVSVNVSGEVLGRALDWMKQRSTVVIEGIRRVEPLRERHLLSHPMS